MVEIIEKRKYKNPTIEYIKIDSEISLILMSGESNPGEPNVLVNLESSNSNPFNCNPYQNNLKL